MPAFFITGTDTEVGKTWLSAGLLRLLSREGLSTIAMKPVASGCARSTTGELRNADAECLMRHMTVAADYADINPYAFAPPIAPHIAASRAGVQIDIDLITEKFRSLANRADAIVVEGVGGWQVPLDDSHTVADLATRLAAPVILVAVIRLGCLNHTLLTVESIRQHSVNLLGWVANPLAADAAALQENIDSLRTRIDAPLLAVMPTLDTFNADLIADTLDKSLLSI